MSDAAQFRHPLILCVEDNADYLLLRKAILEASGYTVISANSSAEALRLVRNFPVSLVISDHLLGGMTGADLATEIKKSGRICLSCCIRETLRKRWEMSVASLEKTNRWSCFSQWSAI
jgi:CheY-like chemotaxis protein